MFFLKHGVYYNIFHIAATVLTVLLQKLKGLSLAP